MRVNLNELAREITLREGLRKQISIAQVKEVMRILLTRLAVMNADDLIKLVRRYAPPGTQAS